MTSLKKFKLGYLIVGFIGLVLVCFCLTSCITINTPANDNNQNNQQNAQSNQQNAQNSQNNQNSAQNSSAEQRAKEVAIKDAGFTEGQVNVIKCHLDYDDGIQKYEVEFTNGTNKFEYDIAANDFRILKKEIDSIYD